MVVIRRIVAGGAAGLALWSAAEYGVHRWVMHGRAGRNRFSVEHLEHHADPDHTVPLGLDRPTLWRAAGLAAVAVPGSIVAGPAVGLAAGAGFTAGYLGYTDLHHRIHHRAPRNPVTRAIWRRHLRHHFGDPHAGYGVTTGLWDEVLHTGPRRTGPVRVPRRLAMTWLTDGSGVVREEYVGDYELVGRAQRTLGPDDRDRALADLVPTPD